VELRKNGIQCVYHGEGFVSRDHQLQVCVNDLITSLVGEDNLIVHLNTKGSSRRWNYKNYLEFYRPDELEVEQNLTHFLNVLNYKLYGKSFRKYGKRVSVVPSWIEVGPLKERLHHHCLFKVPKDRFSPGLPRYSRDCFKHLIRECWKKTDHGSRDIKFDHQHESIVGYITKLKSKSDKELVDWNNFYWTSDEGETL